MMQFLKFPVHIQEKIIDEMEPIPIFDMAQCSKKLHQLVKNTFKPDDYSLELQIGRDYIFEISKKVETEQPNKSKITVTHMDLFDSDFSGFRKIGNFSKIPSNFELFSGKYFFSNPNLFLFFKNVHQGFKLFYDHFLELFQLNFDRVTVDMDYCNYQMACRYLNIFSKNVKKCIFEGTKTVSDPIFLYITRNLNVVESIDYRLEPTQQFQNNVHFHVNHLKIDYAHWVTMEDLLKYDCESIDLSDCSLLNFDLPKMFFQWFMSNFPMKLELLSLKFRENFEDIIQILNDFGLQLIYSEDFQVYEKYSVSTQGCLKIVTEFGKCFYIRIENTEFGGLFEFMDFKDWEFKPFRILELPYLALEEVIRNFDPESALNVSYASKTITPIIKRTLKKVAYDVDVIIYSSGVEFQVFNDLETSQIQVIHENYGHGWSWWMSLLHSATYLFQDLFKIFSFHLYRFEFQSFDSQRFSLSEYRSIIDWCLIFETSCTHSIFRPEIEGDDVTYQLILENSKSERLHLGARPSWNFRIPRLSPNVEHLKLDHAHWVTVDHLLTMDCITVALKKSQMTDVDFNLFLKHLVAGSNQKLEFLRITVDWDIDLDNVLEEIEDEDVVEVWKFEKYDGFVGVTNERGFNILLNNGLTASVSVISDENSLDMLQVIIWK